LQIVSQKALSANPDPGDVLHIGDAHPQAGDARVAEATSPAEAAELEAQAARVELESFGDDA
jgi:hypothetical protein